MGSAGDDPRVAPPHVGRPNSSAGKRDCVRTPRGVITDGDGSETIAETRRLKVDIDRTGAPRSERPWRYRTVIRLSEIAFRCDGANDDGVRTCIIDGDCLGSA